MGTVLGLLGGGGGILTVPILVGFFGMSGVEATGASLLVVGVTGAVGAISGLRDGQCDLRSGVSMAIPSMAGAFSARQWLVPALPERIGPFPKGEFLLLGFAVFMVVVAVRMLLASRRPSVTESGSTRRIAPWAWVVAGLLIGGLSGLFGAGGGFLIVPVLTLAMGLDIRRAIATSLLVIGIQSLGGFLGETGRPLPWALLGGVVAVSLVGMVLGLAVRRSVSARALTPSFALLILAVAGWMFWRAL